MVVVVILFVQGSGSLIVVVQEVKPLLAEPFENYAKIMIRQFSLCAT